MAFSSEAHRRWWFANHAAASATLSSGDFASPRAQGFKDRIDQTEHGMFPDSTTDMRDKYRDMRASYIRTDDQLSEDEKRKLLAYNGAFRGK
jgi:hypothetical protein